VTRRVRRPPNTTPRLLDYQRFASDSAAAYNRLQTDLLWAANPEWFVTHDFMGDFESVDALGIETDAEIAVGGGDIPGRDLAAVAGPAESVTLCP